MPQNRGLNNNPTNHPDEDPSSVERRPESHNSRARVRRTDKAPRTISGGTPRKQPSHRDREARKNNAETPTKDKKTLPTFVFKDMANTTKVFVRQDTPTGALQPPYEGPYDVLSKGEK